MTTLVLTVLTQGEGFLVTWAIDSAQWATRGEQEPGDSHAATFAETPSALRGMEDEIVDALERFWQRVSKEGS